MMTLPEVFLITPFAHRGLHDVAAGRPENSLAAAGAAIAAGYGIELDIQASRDHAAMVFHDHDMARLAGRPGAIRDRSDRELGQMRLLGNGETIPTLAEFLGLVAGRAPLLIEIKDQDGAMGPNVGPLERSVAKALAGYAGPVAAMSFNPHSLAFMAEYAPDVPRGLTTQSRVGGDIPPMPEARMDDLRRISGFDRTGASFIAHDAADLDSPHVAALKAKGVPVLCWTVRSIEGEARARQIADNVIFEGYPAAHPGG